MSNNDDNSWHSIDGEYGDYGLPFPPTDDMREALDNEDIERWMMLYEEALRTRNEN